MAFIDCPKKVLLSQTSVLSFLRRLIGNPLSMRLDENHLRDTILSIESTNAL